MGSSKDTDDIVPVPENVIRLWAELPGTVACNFRPGQDIKAADQPQSKKWRPTYGDGELVSADFDLFLDGIESPTMVVMLYQLYGPEIFTVVVLLEPVICWTNDGLPRLEFDKPVGWNHCPNMWGCFVLAIAKVKGLKPGSIVADPDCGHFIQYVKESGLPTGSVRFRRDLLIDVMLGRFQDFDRGQEIIQPVQAEWHLRVGDRFEYGAGSNISGVAKVVAVDAGGGSATIAKVW